MSAEKTSLAMCTPSWSTLRDTFAVRKCITAVAMVGGPARMSAHHGAPVVAGWIEVVAMGSGRGGRSGRGAGGSSTGARK